MHNNKDQFINPDLIRQTVKNLFETPKPIYVLSPHLDDAIWSIGGLLHHMNRLQYEITIVTLFSHTIFVYDAIRPPYVATTIRKAEDYNASLMAGLKPPLFLDYADGILRDKPLNKVLDPAYETPPYLLDMITECLIETLPKDIQLLVPAAFGGHMDHLTTRRAAMRLSQKKLFFEDLPYALRDHSNDEARDFLTKREYGRNSIPFDTESARQHNQLYNCYPSQTKVSELKQIEAYLEKHGFGIWR